MDLTQFETVGGLAVILTALMQAIKPVLPTNLVKWIPWFAAVLGIILAELAGFGLGSLTRTTAVQLGFTGFLAGFAASGFYQATIDPVKKLTGQGGGNG